MFCDLIVCILLLCLFLSHITKVLLMLLAILRNSTFLIQNLTKFVISSPCRCQSCQQSFYVPKDKKIWTDTQHYRPLISSNAILNKTKFNCFKSTPQFQTVKMTKNISNTKKKANIKRVKQACIIIY